MMALAEVTTMDFSSLTTALQSAMSTGEILSLVGTVVGASVGFVLAWFGARKIVKSVVSAFKGGKIRI